MTLVICTTLKGSEVRSCIIVLKSEIETGSKWLLFDLCKRLEVTDFWSVSFSQFQKQNILYFKSILVNSFSSLA